MVNVFFKYQWNPQTLGTQVTEQTSQPGDRMTEGRIWMERRKTVYFT